MPPNSAAAADGNRAAGSPSAILFRVRLPRLSGKRWADARNKMSTRGLVVAPRFEFDGTTFRFPGVVGLDASDLRQYVLYWDRIDFPDNNLISIGSSPEVEFLISAGVLSRTRVNLRQFSGNIGAGYILAQLAAFDELSAREPAAWSIGQSSFQFVDPEPSASTMRAIEVDLVSVLPVPPETVPLSEVLEFKEKRGEELKALRGALDGLYLQIINARDIPRAKDAALGTLERALADLHKVSQEAWTSRVLRSLKVELNISNLATRAATGAASAVALGLPPAAGAAVGAVSSAVKFDIQELRTPKLPANLKDFAYVFHSQRELK